jgi:hypothetical protein
MQEPLIQWEALEYEQKDRSVDWYWGVSLTTLALIGIALVGDNPLFAIFIIIAAMMTFYFSQRDPHILTITLYDDHICVDNRVFLFSSFASFWVRKQLPQHDTQSSKPTILVLKNKQPFTPILTIPVSDNIDPQELRAFFLDVLEEEEMPEHFSEQIMDRLGF